MSETPTMKIITPEQLRDGWMEIIGVRPIHHQFVVVRKLDDGNYLVRNPECIVREDRIHGW